jgi:lipopolysaccharide transport system ATP-binding protein
MQPETIISIKNIGKKYNITHQQGGYVSLRDVLTNILKSPFAFLKQKTKVVVGLAKKEEFWALRDINLEIKKGEVIGIIGRNGAGKSTLLKILSQITPPTEGEIKINGRVGSLLEVGTGFHAELSGRENIFLNGAILGMTKKEIAQKFDAIVSFAGIEKFLDTPVKRYSSGMYVRLAFSVAAHMEPDILIIDEVLAVGDTEFQKKCLGKMNEITKKEGRTILFVSHNMQAIAQLCPKTILLKDGKIKSVGETEAVLREYSGQFSENDIGKLDLKEKPYADATFLNVTIKNDQGVATTALDHTKNFSVDLKIKVLREIDDADISVTIKNARGFNINFSSLSDVHQGKLRNLKIGNHTFAVKFEKGFLLPDDYSVTIAITRGHYRSGQEIIDERADITGFKIFDTSGSTEVNRGLGSVIIPNKWTEQKNEQ